MKATALSNCALGIPSIMLPYTVSDRFWGLAPAENIFCNALPASTPQLPDTVYGRLMLRIPRAQLDYAAASVSTLATVPVAAVDSHVQ